MTYRFALTSAAVALLTLAPATLRAQSLDVDFGLSGETAAETGFAVFESTSAGVTGPLARVFDPQTVGNSFSTPITVTLNAFNDRSGTVGQILARNRQASAVSDSGALTFGELYRDFVRASSSTNPVLRVAISGLAANTPYVFTIYSYDAQGGNNSTNTIDYVQTGSTVPFGSVTYVGMPSGSEIRPTFNSQFSATTTLTTDANGNLSVDARYVSGTERSAPVNAIQISPVPEPSAALLALAAGVPLLARRRRK